MLALVLWLVSQDAPLFTPDFPAAEFQARRERVQDAIGPQAIALLKGAPAPHSSARFRQSNQFFYLSGVETPHAYLLVDGARRRTSLYLPHQEERRAETDGKKLAAEDVDLVKSLAGVDEVFGNELLAEHLARLAFGRTAYTVYTPFQPGEGLSESRDGALRATADLASDPFGGRPSSEGHLLELLAERWPQLALRDLSPILDRLRLIKSSREVDLIRRATELSGLTLMEAMRSTAPGVREYELEALGKFIFWRGGAQADAYTAIVASGKNAWYQHYRAGSREMQKGELVVMDFAPDIEYYRSDLTRTWPVSGKWSDAQRELYGFYLSCYRAVLKAIRPGVTAQAVKQDALRGMEGALERARFLKPSYADAARKFVEDYKKGSEDPKTALGHWVGMATHDVGDDAGPLRPGMVFTIEPALRVPEEQIYVRAEDAILITERGAEILSDFVPLDLDEIEALMREEGLLQRYPRPTSPTWVGRR